MPIDPRLQSEFRRVSFSRGAQATTAIEGNTLSDEEVQKVLDGIELPKSRAYQAKEVKNALAAMQHVWRLVIQDGCKDLVTPKLLRDLNKLIGQELGNLFDGVPGKFRQDRRSVGRYLTPKPEFVEPLVQQLCEWLRREFRFESGEQPMHEAIIQAIVSHVYFEWIHPFADGNGRTGRMLEFFILLRAGLPDIAAHVLANHYNGTRTEYAAHFDNARTKRDLSEFIEYAVQGMLDGLQETLKMVEDAAFRIVWRSFIYDVFAEYTDYKKRNVFKRRRALALEMPTSDFTVEQLLQHSEALLKLYMKKDRRTLHGDLAVLVDLGLVEQDGDIYRPAIGQLGPHVVRRAVNSPVQTAG
jgi:Fic family protein